MKGLNISPTMEIIQKSLVQGYMWYELWTGLHGLVQDCTLHVRCLNANLIFLNGSNCKNIVSYAQFVVCLVELYIGLIIPHLHNVQGEGHIIYFCTRIQCYDKLKSY